MFENYLMSALNRQSAVPTFSQPTCPTCSQTIRMKSFNPVNFTEITQHIEGRLVSIRETTTPKSGFKKFILRVACKLSGVEEEVIFSSNIEQKVPYLTEGDSILVYADVHFDHSVGSGITKTLFGKRLDFFKN